MSETRDFTDRASRVLDIVLSAAGLVVLGPLMLLIAAAVVLDGGGPVFFAQTRLGQGGRHFRMYKFRKFHARAGSSGPLLTRANDSRMSRLGRLLAATKLDELPQLWNILRGDMAVVGPRPESLAFADGLSGRYRRVLDFRPGIFGPGQVAFRYEGDLYPANADAHAFYIERILPLKARLDLEYYQRRSLAGDIVWIVRGILAVLGLQAAIRELPETRAMGPLPTARPVPPATAESGGEFLARAVHSIEDRQIGWSSPSPFPACVSLSADVDR